MTNSIIVNEKKHENEIRQINQSTCETNKTKPKRRCPVDGCGKKLQLTDMECKCGVIHCTMHRLPETHECTFDHKVVEGAKLATRLMQEKTVAAKVVSI